jgi:hypothetical protein
MRAPTIHLSEKLCCETRRLVHYYAQQQYKQGHSALVRKGDFIYSYFWMEDMTRDLAPASGLKYCELYTLHLGIVRADIVKKNLRCLLRHLWTMYAVQKTDFIL